jgi:hypothetical protein
MAIARQAAPIKFGLLTDMVIPKTPERVKMVPAASGSPGTCISFGKWTRRRWMGAGYLTARALNPDRTTHSLAGRYEAL